MKRNLCIVLAILIVLFAPSVASAEETAPVEDSTYVSEEIRDLLGVPEDATVTRMYNTLIISDFNKTNTIEDVLASPKIQILYYVETLDGTVKELLLTDGVVTDVNQSQFTVVDSEAMQVYKSGSVLDLLGEDVVVQNVYYLTGYISHTGTAIYYRTNKGDYVYYRWHKLGEFGEAGELFLTAENFGKLMDEIYAEMLKHSGMDGGPDLSKIWDLSSFRIDSPTFNLHAPWTGVSNNVNEQPGDASIWIRVVVIAVLAVVSVTVGFVVHKKRRAHT